jgi:four helix bundle protein
MGFAKRFEELEVWKKARHQVRDVYRAFARLRDYSFRDQVQRATVSVMSNIAEGFERKSKRDFAHFLNVSKASCGEVRSLMYAAEDLGVLDAATAQGLREQAETLSRQIATLARRIQP